VCVAACCSVLQCAAVSCSVLQCVVYKGSWRMVPVVAKVDSVCVLQHVAVCCSGCSVLQCVAVCCSGCNVLHCV